MDDKGTVVSGYSLSNGHRTYIFVLLFLLYFFDVVDRYMVSSMFPYIQKEWGLTDMQSGLLVSTVYWSILILVFPASIIIDRWSRRKTISIMAVCWSIASMACAFVANFGQLFVARTFLGIGEAGYAAGGTAMITGLYPVEKRARMMGIWNASIPVATAVAIAVGGVIATHLGWRAAFGLTALPGLIVAIMFFFIKDYKTVDLVKTVKAGADMSAKVKMKAADAARESVRTPSLIFTYLGMGGVQFVAVGLITWLPTYFNRTAGIPMDQAGLKAGAVMLLAVVGAPLGGFLSDLWVKKKIDSRLLFAAITTFVTAVFTFAAFFLFDGNIQFIFLLLMGVSIIAFIPAAAATTQEVIHPGLRAISAGLSVVATSLIGGSLAPIVIGAISDAAGIQTAMMVLPAFLVVAAVLFFIGSFFFMKDYNKVEKIQLQAES
ncbi:MAG: MFS transporter [Dehalococcoidia bacterium]|nr:MFS transporter [Dehalococcoidia bacterium]